MFSPLFRNATVYPAMLALALSALAGCASVSDRGSKSTENDPATSLRAELQIDHALPAISTEAAGDSEEMLGGSVRLGTPSGLIDYGASYRVRQGKFFQAIRDGNDDLEQAQGEVALQTLEQTLGSTLPLPAGAPLVLQLTRREDTRLGVDRGTTSQSTRADLSWSPGPFDLSLEWTRPDPDTLSGKDLNCDLRAGLQLPAGFLPAAAGSMLELTGQRCRGSSQAHGIGDLVLARWGAAWHWGVERNTALRVLRTEAQTSAGTFMPLTPDYELGLTHSRMLPGGWQAQADFSVLRTDPVVYASNAPSETDGTDWTARFALKRDLKLLAVTARWARAAERIWFATATKQVAGDRFSLALDFGAWLARLWPSVESAMDVSWDWRQTRKGEDDSKVSWNMLIDW